MSIPLHGWATSTQTDATPRSSVALVALPHLIANSAFASGWCNKKRLLSDLVICSQLFRHLVTSCDILWLAWKDTTSVDVDHHQRLWLGFFWRHGQYGFRFDLAPESRWSARAAERQRQNGTDIYYTVAWKKTSLHLMHCILFILSQQSDPPRKQLLTTGPAWNWRSWRPPHRRHDRLPQNHQSLTSGHAAQWLQSCQGHLMPLAPPRHMK